MKKFVKIAKCVLCGELCSVQVYDPNLGRFVFLCGTCQNKFTQCSNCGIYYSYEDLINGICYSCRK